MPRQIGRRARNAPARQIIRRSGKVKRNTAQPFGNHVIRQRIRQAQPQILAVAVQIHVSVGQCQLQFHIRIAPAVCRHHAREHIAGKPNGRANPQRPLRIGRARTRLLRRLCQKFQRIRTIAVIRLALLRRFQAAVISVKQPRPHRLFQMGNMLARHRYGNTYPLRRARKTAALHHLAKHFHA